jgi:hypothetical protein
MDDKMTRQDQRAVGFVLDAADIAVELVVDLPHQLLECPEV